MFFINILKDYKNRFLISGEGIVQASFLQNQL